QQLVWNPKERPGLPHLLAAVQLEDLLLGLRVVGEPTREFRDRLSGKGLGEEKNQVAAGDRDLQLLGHGDGLDDLRLVAGGRRRPRKGEEEEKRAGGRAAREVPRVRASRGSAR